MDRKYGRLIALGCSLALMCACTGRSGDLLEDDTKAEWAPQTNIVEVMELKRGDFPMQLISNGRLEATRRASLGFAESGVIRSVRFSNGDRVEKGAVIAILDNSSQSIALESAGLSKEKARLEYLDVLAGLGYSVTEKALPSVPDSVRALCSLRSGYSAAQIELRRAEAALEGTIIRAPFSGKVADISAKQYERAGAEPFCTLIDDSSFEVTFSALESEFAFLNKGQTVKLSLFSDPGKEVKGYISSINPTIDRNGQIAVTAKVRGDASLIDGMNVKVTVQKNLPGKLVVPKRAVVIRDQLEVLFRYRDGKAEWVYVNTLEANSDSYVVEANTDRGAVLNEGDMIIVSGNLNLADGSTVTVKQK